MATMERECYLCGKRANETPEGRLTRDHLPPKNLFPPSRPPNLITVHCCYACNNQEHKDDEYLRLAVSGYYNTNDAGKQIWNEKVQGSTLKKGRLRKSVDDIRGSLKKIALITPESIKDAYEMTLERDPIDRVLTRMTKGFLARFHPEINRHELTFRADQLDQFQLNDPAFNRILKALDYFQKGSGVYRCWHRIEDYSFNGVWVHMFFDCAAFFVEQSSDRKIVMPW
jgi:hypothetical protein